MRTAAALLMILVSAAMVAAALVLIGAVEARVFIMPIGSY